MIDFELRELCYRVTGGRQVDRRPLQEIEQSVMASTKKTTNNGQALRSLLWINFVRQTEDAVFVLAWSLEFKLNHTEIMEIKRRDGRQ